MNRRRAFSHVEVLIVVVILLILGIVAIPNYEEARTRRRVAQSLNDMATLGAAIEAYRTDRGTFPAMAMLAAVGGSTIVPPGGSPANGSATIDLGVIPTFGGFYQRGRTFRTNGAQTATGQLFAQITTPVAYIPSYPVDPFADTPGLSFRYHHDANGWIIGSYGPDEDEETAGDIPWNAAFPALPPSNPTTAQMEFAYRSSIAQPSVTLLTGPLGSSGFKGSFTYDPTNGAGSQGDIWRVRTQP